MRLALAVILLAASVTSAHAQRVDTRRYRVGELDKETVSCRFKANPDLELQHKPGGSTAHAGWVAKAAGSDATHAISLLVELYRVPGSDEASIFYAGFEVRNEHEAFPRPITSARILVDGKDSAIPTRLEGTLRMARGARNTLRVIPLEGQEQPFGQLLMDANAITLELLDADRSVVRSYDWDVRRFDDDVERLQLVHWGCTTPDR